MRNRLLPIIALLIACLAHGQAATSTTQALPPAQISPSLEGTSTKLTLLSAVSSKLPKDSRFQARLEQALQVNGQVILPQGTLFEGYLEPMPARRLIRAGALRLIFDRMILPDGTTHPAKLALTGVQYKAVKTDTEGTIRPKRSKKRLLFQIGGALLIAKAADDIAEVASASVTKGIARFIGFGAAAGFVLLQKGGEVKVPEGTDIEVTFGRESEVLPLGVAVEPQPSNPQH
jgi:hypothetical protein